MASPIRPTDDDARALARGLMTESRHAALGVTLPEDGGPMVTRIACAPGPAGDLLSLVSDLSLHTRALRAAPQCSLLLGEPGTKGDPLTHPRLTVQAEAAFVHSATSDHDALAARYLSLNPKAKLYAGFADFHLVRFTVIQAFLNGGFGKAYVLTPADLAAP